MVKVAAIRCIGAARRPSLRIPLGDLDDAIFLQAPSGELAAVDAARIEADDTAASIVAAQSPVAVHDQSIASVEVIPRIRAVRACFG